MLSLWQCAYCDLKNYPQNNHCQACFKISTQLSPIDTIIHQQQLLFYGFIRIKIANHMTNSQIIPNDVINLTLKFYELPIKSLMSQQTKDLNLSPENKSLQEQHSLFGISIECKGNHEYFISYKILTLLTKCDETESYYHCLLGSLLKDMNMIKEATYHLQTAITLDPHIPEHRYDFGLLLKKQAEYQLALEQFLKCKEMDLSSQSVESRFVFQCAYCYMKLGQNELANAEFLQLLSIEPQKSIYNEYYARFLCKSLKDYPSARKYFEIGIALEPDNILRYYRYGLMLRDYMCDYQGAKKQYLKCLKMDKTKYNASYGYLLYLMGEYEKGLRYIEIDLSVNDGYKWPNFYHGLVNKTLGNDEIAEKSLLKAVEGTKITKTYNLEFMMEEVNIMKKSDGLNGDYYERFQELLNEKFREN